MASPISSRLFFFVVAFAFLGLAAANSCAECDMNIGQLVESKGLEAQSFMTPSIDGKLQLNIWRVISKKGNSTAGPPVIVQHGLEDSGATYVVNERDESLPFILADAGFDVWLPNSRGNMYSPCKTDECWNFSFDEMALYDMPTFIDFVLNKTGRKQVSWVGCSQGTTQAFAAFSTAPTTAKKVNLFIALAPVAFVEHQKSALFKFLSEMHVDDLFKLFGIKQYMQSSPISRGLAKLFCAKGDITQAACESTLFSVMGKNPSLNSNLNQSRFDVYVAQASSGTSVQNMAHWAQLSRNGGFHMYDFGESGNYANYGQATPPAYNISKITVPTAFFSGGQDFLADPIDVSNLIAQYNPKYVVATDVQENYDHADFGLGLDAHVKIYPRVMELLKKYT